MKYFVLGSMASGMLLYGMSMIYGATGSLDLQEIAAAVQASGSDSTLLVFGLVFLVVGIAFKLGVVPFHMWIPDVYEGAPVATTLFISSVPKMAAFAMAIRLLETGLGTLQDDWSQMLAILAMLGINWRWTEGVKDFPDSSGMTALVVVDGYQWWVALIILVFGAAVGMIGSGIAASRFLDV